MLSDILKGMRRVLGVRLAKGLGENFEDLILFTLGVTTKGFHTLEPLRAML